MILKCLIAGRLDVNEGNQNKRGGLVEKWTIFNRWGWTIKRGGNFENSKENLEHEIWYDKFAILHEQTNLRLTFWLNFFFYNSTALFYANEMLANKKK